MAARAARLANDLNALIIKMIQCDVDLDRYR